jgi:hypothetical protein
MRRATHAGVEPARASHGDFTTNVSTSAYFDAPSATRKVSVEPARLIRSHHATRRTAGYDDAWTGVYGDHGGVGKSAVRLSAVPSLARALPEDADPSALGARSTRPAPLHELELDVNTANVLAKQQAQLLELHAQVQSLKAQLSLSRGRAAGETRGSLRTSDEWRARGSTGHAAYARPTTKGDGEGEDHQDRTQSSTAVDASTNTMWTPDVAASLERMARERERVAGADADADADAESVSRRRDAWSYEGGGRKSRGSMTDGGSVLLESTETRFGGQGEKMRAIGTRDLFGSARDGDGDGDGGARRSKRSGVRVIRRSVAALEEVRERSWTVALPNDSPPPGLSPAKAMPPLPAAASRPERRTAEEASFGNHTHRLIPSRNSAFTPVGGDPGKGLAIAGGLPETNVSPPGPGPRSGSGSGPGSGPGPASSPASGKSGSGAPEGLPAGSFGYRDADAGRRASETRVVAPTRRVRARAPLFLEGDGSPTSPGRDDDDAESEVLRVSRDTFAELSRGARGASDGERSRRSFDDLAEEDDDARSTDSFAGTTVTGTTAGRGASEWAFPARWGSRAGRMSEAACWEAGSGGTDGGGSDGGGSDDEIAATEYWKKEMPEGMPMIAYQPMTDDESSDDEEMRAIYAKYSVGATRSATRE